MLIFCPDILLNYVPFKIISLMFNFPVEKIISHENKVFYVFFKYLLTGLECVTLVPL